MPCSHAFTTMPHRLLLVKHPPPSPVDEATQLPDGALQGPGGLVELKALAALGSILQEGQAVLWWWCVQGVGGGKGAQQQGYG
jgi:hypothetical protein